MTNLLRLPPSTSMPVYTGAAPASQRCDTARVLEWMRTPNRKAAQFAFTEGQERQAAYWIEIAQGEQAPQPTCKQDLQVPTVKENLTVETEQERYVRVCPDIECGRKKRCTRMVGVSCMSRADIAPAAQPIARPDTRKVIEQMVEALEIAERHLAYVKITEAREAGQKWLEENK